MKRLTCNIACTHCRNPTAKPRRGLCFACYQRDRRGALAADPCAVCGIADKRVLRFHKLADVLTSLCANHAAIAGRRQITLDALKREAFPDGDRRTTERRQTLRRSPTDRRERDSDAHTLGQAAELRTAERRTA